MEATQTSTAHPPIATQAEWLAARKQLLLDEKAHTKEYDRINAARRRLPMVKVEKEYRFHNAEGSKSLLDLFDGKDQLIVYHFMFDPSWDKGCPGCTSFIDALGDLSELPERRTTFVVTSLAPTEKLEAYKKEKGWDIDWYTCDTAEFNRDFGVTIDPEHPPLSYNYKTGDDLQKAIGEVNKPTEMPGTSVFFRIGNDIYHTYSTYARGGESLTDSYRLLDLTPYGRQEDFEDSPAGWPQKPTYG